MQLSQNQSKFSDILKYLEEEKDRDVKNKSQSAHKKIVAETKKAVNDSLEPFYSDVTVGPVVKKSKGFDVNKFESLMRSKLIDQHKRMQSYERPYISVTELISCLRKSYFSRMKYEIDIDKEYSFSYLYLINKVGDTVHSVVQELYNLTEVEKSIISEKYKVKGRVDGIKDNILQEYKTIDVAKFKDKYIDAHYDQANIYACILNKEYSYNIDLITIVYFIRNCKRVVPFDLELDYKRAEDFLRRGNILLQAIKSNTIPDTIGSTEEQCKWCSYKKYCNNKENTKKSTFLL